MKRDVEIVVLAAYCRVDFSLGEPVHAVERLDAQHVATKLHRVERRRLGEAEPAGERQTIEEGSLLRCNRRAQQLLLE